VSNFNNLFSGSAIIKLRGYLQTGILKASSYTREITLCLSFTDLPIHRVNQAQARRHAKGSETRSNCTSGSQIVQSRPDAENAFRQF